MKKIILIISLNFIALLVMAQDSSSLKGSYDSMKDISWCRHRIVQLKKQVEFTKEDTNRVLLYDDISYKYGFFKKDSSVFYQTLVYELSKKIGYENGIKMSLFNLANLNNIFGNYLESIKLTTELVNIAESSKDTSYLLSSLTYLTYTYGEAKDFDNELKYAKIIASLLNFYSNKTEANLYASVTINNIGDAFMNKGELDSALFYFQSSYQTALKFTDSDQFLPLLSLGDINYKMNNFALALEYYRKSLKILPESAGRTDKIKIMNALGIAFEKLNNQDSAILYFTTAYKLATAQGFLQGVLNSSEKLSKIYTTKRVYDSAFKYQNIYIATKDSLYNVDKVRLLDNFNFKEEILQKELLEQKNQAQEDRRRNIRLALIAVFIPVFSAFVYFIGKKRKINHNVITLLGLASLLMFFEFITLLIHPLIEKITKHDAILMYLILLIIASILAPLHHRLETFVKTKL